MVTMPKLNPREVVGLVRSKEASVKTKSGGMGSVKSPTKLATKKLSLLEEAMLCATESGSSTIVERKFEKLELLD